MKQAMLKIKFLLIICSILMLMFWGCRSYLPKTDLSNNGTTVTESSLSTAYPTNVPQVTLPSSTTSQIIVTDIQKQCANPQPLLNNLIKPSSVFFISTYKEDSDYFWDFEKKISIPAPFSKSGYKAWGTRISPNGQWIASEVDKDSSDNNVIVRSLNIYDASGKEKSSLPWGENWGVLRSWLDNERLFIDGMGQDSNATFIVYPFKDKIEKLSSFLSNAYKGDSSTYWSVSPDSKLSLELYLTGLTLKEGIGYSLWDIKKNKEIWHLDSRVAPQVPPLWSSDYSKFVVLKEQSAIENRADILVLDNTGRTIFQTDFASNYSYSFVSRYMSLSPNGRYLVTWISLGNDANIPDRPSIVLLDLKTGIATNLCMTSYGIGSDLIWSPDSNWLITRPDSVDVNVLINIYTNKIYSISLPLDGSIIGWMNRP